MNFIADQETSESISKYFEFSVDDKDGALECKAPNLSYEVVVDPGDSSSLVASTGAVSWGGSWPVCSATITPKTGERGAVHIKIKFNDGNPLATAERVFQLKVNGVNKPPEILTDIGSQTVPEDGSLTVNFEVRDLDFTAANSSDYRCDSTRLTYSSGNTALVAAVGRVVWDPTASWPFCKGVITPNANANGTVNLTFTVTDPGGLSASKTFQLSITPQNDTPVGNVVCDSNSASDIIKAGRTGNWSVSCSGASDVDLETLTYSLHRDAASPFNSSSNFACPAAINGPSLSQAFSTTDHGTCKYKARACDSSGACTSNSLRFVEITSYRLNLSLGSAKPTLSDSCVVSNTLNFEASTNISSFSYSATLVQQDSASGPSGIAAVPSSKSVGSETDNIPLVANVVSGFLLATPAKDTISSTFKTVFNVTGGTFSGGTQGGSASGNTISNSLTSALYTIERRLENLTVKPMGDFSVTGLSVDGFQTEYASTPSMCRRCNSATYASISAGSLHSCLIDGSVSKCWGRNDGRLGLASAYGQNNYTYPMTTSVSFSSHSTSGFVPLQVAGGKDFTCALGLAGTSNQIRCTGDNVSGQLGLASAQKAFTNAVSFPAGESPVAISVSKTGTHACAISNSSSVQGRIFCWGANESGQLGNGSSTTSAGTVYSVSKGDLTDQNSKIFSMTTGRSHTCAIQFQSSNSTSQAFCWGKNNFGQLGVGGAVNSQLPLFVNVNDDPVQISAGDNHTCALTKNKEVYCWGDNSVGQLGIGNTTSSASPVKISSSLTFVQISAGSNHTCALTHDSKVYCWGLGTSGQLGVGKVTTNDQESGEDCNSGIGVANITFCKQSPSIIDPAPSTTPVTISAGDLHTCMMTIEGYVYCWGANTEGQLGTSNKSQVSSPAAVCSSGTQCTTSGQLTTPRPRICSRYLIP